MLMLYYAIRFILENNYYLNMIIFNWFFYVKLLSWIIQDLYIYFHLVAYIFSGNQMFRTLCNTYLFMGGSGFPGAHNLTAITKQEINLRYTINPIIKSLLLK